MLCFFKIIDEGKFPRLCISLMPKTVAVQHRENAVYLGAILSDRQTKNNY
jgi:hypothetical protein